MDGSVSGISHYDLLGVHKPEFADLRPLEFRDEGGRCMHHHHGCIKGTQIAHCMTKSLPSMKHRVPNETA